MPSNFLRVTPWAAIDSLPPGTLQSLGVVSIAEINVDGALIVRVFVNGDPNTASSRLPASFNGFPVEIEESGPVVAINRLSGLKQIRYYNSMDVPEAPPPPMQPPVHHYAGQVTDVAQAVTQPITDVISSTYAAVTDAVGTASSAASATVSAATSTTDAAQAAYADQTQQMKNYLAQQRALAQGSASAAGQQASTSAQNLGTIVLVSAAAIVLVLWLTRK
jgi:hypothetical protein